MRPSLYRLLSPAGFLASGVAFAFPFIVVDDLGPQNQMVYSGVDLLHSGTPTVIVTNTDTAVTTAFYGSSGTLLHPDAGRPLIIACVVLIIIGGAAGLIRRPLVRLTGGAAAAATAAILMVADEISAPHAIRSVLIDETARYSQTSTDQITLPPELTINAGVGFWIALIVLTAAFLFNLVQIIVDRTSQTPSSTELAPAGPTPG